VAWGELPSPQTNSFFSGGRASSPVKLGLNVFVIPKRCEESAFIY